VVGDTLPAILGERAGVANKARNRFSGIVAVRLGSTGVATVTGSGSQWNNKYNLSVGDSGHGTLNIEAGGVVNVAQGSNLGRLAGATGVATVSGNGSRWNNGRQLSLGYLGTGTLNVDAGGVVNNTDGYLGSTSAATISGSGSQWNNSNGLFLGGTATGDAGMGTLNLEGWGQVNVGNDWYTGIGTVLTVSDTGSNGTLFVRNGSVINNSGSGQIGLNSGSAGVATVTGDGSQWNNSSEMVVGSAGQGTLSIEGGGLVSNTFSYLGSLPGSTGVATVSGANSQWDSSDFLAVGLLGKGTLNIEAGGTVSNTFGYLGYLPNSTGVARVSGSGSQWQSFNDIYVAHYGAGTLKITGGGLVSVAETLTIDFDTNGDGFINMSTGGMLALFGEADDSLAEFLDLIDGTDAIRYWDAGIADWANITGATYGNDYTLSYLTAGDLTGYTLLRVGMVGDFDGNGIVDGGDFSFWQSDPGVGPLSDWEAHYGMAAPIAAVSATVPEPATSVLALATLGLAMNRRRRRPFSIRYSWTV
jgi:T5SS/PEP-CTERM-associated repeat protein